MPIYALGNHMPMLPESDRYWVAPGAHVIGKVRLGLDVGIWFGAVLRGDNEPLEVGDRSNIQDGAMLHADPGFPLKIGADCTIGHHAVLHGCTIGAGTLIGMGATIMNGAKIGARSLVGANALVTEGKEFPEGSLIIGAPAKEARPLPPDSARRFLETAEGYVKRWRLFKAELKRID